MGGVIAHESNHRQCAVREVLQASKATKIRSSTTESIRRQKQLREVTLETIAEAGTNQDSGVGVTAKFFSLEI